MGNSNINRAKARRSGNKAWIVGEHAHGVGRSSFMNRYVITRTPLGKNMPGNSVDLVSNVNQLGGIGRFNSQFATTADGVNVLPDTDIPAPPPDPPSPPKRFQPPYTGPPVLVPR